MAKAPTWTSGTYSSNPYEQDNTQRGNLNGGTNAGYVPAITNTTKTGVENPTPPSGDGAGTGSGSGSGSGYSGGGGGGGGSSASSKPKWKGTIESDAPTADGLLNPNGSQNAKDILSGAGLANPEGVIDVDGAKLDRVENIDIEPEKQMLQQLTDAQKQQVELQANRAVEQGTIDLQRSQQDAQDQFNTQQKQINIDEQKALDNQVLYSEARGDRGGIGQAQYNTIQNTAATNRLNVQKQQTKLASDTQRQIADLRAQGEFEKADALLSISQKYLSELMQLNQWAKETNISIDEFNIQLAEWENNYKLSLLDAEINVANATGAFTNGNPTLAAWQQQQQALAASGQALMEAGIAPSTQQLQAMGWNQTQATNYLNKYFG